MASASSKPDSSTTSPDSARRDHAPRTPSAMTLTCAPLTMSATETDSAAARNVDVTATGLAKNRTVLATLSRARANTHPKSRAGLARTATSAPQIFAMGLETASAPRSSATNQTMPAASRSVSANPMATVNMHSHQAGQAATKKTLTPVPSASVRKTASAPQSRSRRKVLRHLRRFSFAFGKSGGTPADPTRAMKSKSPDQVEPKADSPPAPAKAFRYDATKNTRFAFAGPSQKKTSAPQTSFLGPTSIRSRPP